MKIYTKTGDKGETGLFGGERVRKSSERIAAYGDVDELNSFIGLLQSKNDISEIHDEIQKIQNDLFDLGAVLATPNVKKLEGRAQSFVSDEDVIFLEHKIDAMEKSLKPLQTFILPGGSELAALCHLARTVCRRAERKIVGLTETEKIPAEIITYMNRLSDYLFVLARWINFKKNSPDIAWQKK